MNSDLNLKSLAYMSIKQRLILVGHEGQLFSRGPASEYIAQTYVLETFILSNVVVVRHVDP